MRAKCWLPSKRAVGHPGSLRSTASARLGLLAVALALTVAGIGFVLRASRDRPLGVQPLPDAAAGRLGGEFATPPAHVARTVHFDLLARLLADDRRSDSSGEWLERLADPRAPCRVETQPHPLLGKPAADFTLRDHQNQPWNLVEHLAGGPVVLVFYLGYSCNACVHNLCELNADLDRFGSFAARVVAVSGDPPEFTEERFNQFGSFGFAVLSDPDHAVARQYGTCRAEDAPESDRGAVRLVHGTFVLDRQGIVRWAHCGELPFRNDLALLYELMRLTDQRSSPQAEALP
jgi:peroxiredoxin